ncbi:MAG: hypothetical protein R2942_02045 [Ignavibacteria bacterium]
MMTTKTNPRKYLSGKSSNFSNAQGVREKFYQKHLSENAVRQNEEYPVGRQEYFKQPDFFTGWQSVNPTGMFYGKTNDNRYFRKNKTALPSPSDRSECFLYISPAGVVWKTTDGDNSTALTG